MRCGISNPQYLGMVAGYDFEGVLMDMQHGFFDESTILNGITAVAAKGKAPLVRIPVGRWDTASRVMDFGALGVVAPMINSAEDAQSFASAMKYIPRGERSFGPRYAAATYGVTVPEYLDGIDDSSLALAMIETREAVDAVEEIVAVDGIDGVLIGPFAMVPEHANMLAELGADLISIGVDDTYVDKGVAMHLEQLNFV